MRKCHLYCLSTIVTNECNLDCAHCLRGQKNCATMSDEVIETTLNQIESIGVLNIAGGEPTLAIDRIEKIIDYIIRKRIKLDNFSIVINGTIYSQELLELLDEISKYIGDIEFHTLFTVSLDKYHLDEIKRLGLYKEFIENLRRYRESKYFIFTSEDSRFKPFREGNAELLDRKSTVPLLTSTPAITYIKDGKFDIKNGLCHIGPFITINPDGIMTDCNASIAHQKIIYNYGSVLDETIEDICIRNRVRVLKPRQFTKVIKKQIHKFENYNR